MDIRVFFGAIIGAFLGAFLWAAITILTGYEVGYVAWAVGGLTGMGAMLMGGRGSVIGVTCAVLALAAILLGRLITINYVLDAELEAVAEEETSKDAYNMMAAEAEEFAGLTSDDDYPAFMAKHGYSESTTAGSITAEEVGWFTEYSVPRLRAFHANKPSYEQWRAESEEEFYAYANAVYPPSQAILDSLSPIDLIFALLGIVTAYRIGANGLGAQEGQSEAAA